MKTTNMAECEGEPLGHDRRIDTMLSSPSRRNTGLRSLIGVCKSTHAVGPYQKRLVEWSDVKLMNFPTRTTYSCRNTAD